MTQLEVELSNLNKALCEMMALSRLQLIKSKEAIINLDHEIAQEVLHNEIRLDAYELSIDRDCENILALFQPVAIDLRYVLSILRMNSDVERIGDVAKNIAKYSIKLNTPFNPDYLKSTRYYEIFDNVISMYDDIMEAMVEENTLLARKVFLKDTYVDQINKEAAIIITDIIKKDTAFTENGLFLYSSFMRLERVGDYLKSIAEEIIFHYEAKVLKHNKAKNIVNPN